MKKTITKIAIALSLATTVSAEAQTTVTFDTFTLSSNSYYQDNASMPFSSGVTTFHYEWDPSFGGYWSGGTSYTNVNDTVNGTYTNLYGSITGTAFSGNNYATTKNNAVISFTNNTTAVSGFYLTNTTYAWKSIKNGDSFARKFGDTTGTGSGTSIAQGEYPDWFKVIVRGYRGGIMINDSVEFYLADYRFAGTINDYVVKNWQYLNCSSLGQVDSIKFEMKSSDMSFGFINQPAFFSIDNFVTLSTVGIEELSNASNISLFPNPASQFAILNYESTIANELFVSISDISGKEVQQNCVQASIGINQLKLNTESLEAGLYFVIISNGKETKKIKLIKF